MPTPKLLASETEKFRLRKIASLLDQIAGSGQGRRFLDRLLKTDGLPAAIAGEIAKSSAFGRLYKQARTLDIMTAGQKEADPKFVGLAELDPNLPFNTQLEHFFLPKLARRADGFAAIFKSVTSREQRPLIIETGCLRIPGNWEGDGQSSFMFDAMVRDRHGVFLSIDVTPECVDTARRACSSATQLICNNSIAALYALSQITHEPASLLYLDSFDLDRSDPMPSAIHHLMELTAARSLIGPGTIVCVDDYAVGDQQGGKGLLLDKFFTDIRAEVLHSGYQKAWRIT